MSDTTSRDTAAAQPAEVASGDYFPTERDRAIFHARRVLGRPAAEVAAEFGIALRTVRNIVGTVGDAVKE